VDVRFRNGPFFLFNLDLHSGNVTVNRNWQVAAILDWEFASSVPIEIAFSPPRCIMDRHHVDEMRPNSDYKLYLSRLRIFIEKIKVHLTLSYTQLSDLAPAILDHLGGALCDRRAFFAWSAIDARKQCFYLLCEHLALASPIAIENKGDFVFKGAWKHSVGLRWRRGERGRYVSFMRL
jgi:hypothetical protein